MAEQLTPRQHSRQVEDVRGSGIYPATGPFPPGDAVVRTPGALGHPEERRVVQSSAGSVRTAAFLAGRAIFGGYFVYNGVNHLINRQMLAGYARSKGVTAADLAVTGSGLLILAGGLSILTGARPKAGAGLLSAFLLGVSPIMHAFLREDDAQARTSEMVNFTKNMALLGAALMAAAHPEPWPWSLRIGYSSMLPARG
jgi:putative oxidoreductase